MGSTARLDLSDSALKDAVLKVRSDASPETFCVLGYEGKAKIVLTAENADVTLPA